MHNGGFCTSPQKGSIQGGAEGTLGTVWFLPALIDFI